MARALSNQKGLSNTGAVGQARVFSCQMTSALPGSFLKPSSLVDLDPPDDSYSSLIPLHYQLPRFSDPLLHREVFLFCLHIRVPASTFWTLEQANRILYFHLLDARSPLPSTVSRRKSTSPVLTEYSMYV
jgi:hypothetical protein